MLKGQRFNIVNTPLYADHCNVVQVFSFMTAWPAYPHRDFDQDRLRVGCESGTESSGYAVDDAGPLWSCVFVGAEKGCLLLQCHHLFFLNQRPGFHTYNGFERLSPLRSLETHRRSIVQTYVCFSKQQSVHEHVISQVWFACAKYKSQRGPPS